jgi:hypothetical protein
MALSHEYLYLPSENINVSVDVPNDPLYVPICTNPDLPTLLKVGSYLGSNRNLTLVQLFYMWLHLFTTKPYFRLNNDVTLLVTEKPKEQTQTNVV